MPGPFPGMDPYLESTLYWRGAHLQMINNIVANLQPQLAPNYVARIDERITLLSLPDRYYPDVAVLEAVPPSPRGNTLTAPERSLKEISEPE